MMPEPTSRQLETATLAAGCFWCTEAIFQRLRGVASVTSGYAGGEDEKPSYETVSAGTTGHAEAIQIEFDPTVLPYERLLEIFWHTHDPTTRDQQGADVGPQYRSSVFYHTDAQREAALALKEQLDASGEFDDPIVTDIMPFTAFYPAEQYHQKFYDENPTHPYCLAIIDPKLQKLVKDYGDVVADE